MSFCSSKVAKSSVKELSKSGSTALVSCIETEAMIRSSILLLVRMLLTSFLLLSFGSIALKSFSNSNCEERNANKPSNERKIG